MALATHALPFGLRDVKIFSLDAQGETPGAATDLPAARTLTFTDSESFEELRGDDSIIASHGSGASATWDLEQGGINLDVYKLIMGGNVSSSGVTPNVIKTYAKLGTDARPYFQAKGQIISDSGGDLWCVLYKCKATGDVSGEFADGAFFTPGLSGAAYPNAAGKLYDFVQHETTTAIT